MEGGIELAVVELGSDEPVDLGALDAAADIVGDEAAVVDRGPRAGQRDAGELVDEDGRADRNDGAIDGERTERDEWAKIGADAPGGLLREHAEARRARARAFAVDRERA